MVAGYDTALFLDDTEDVLCGICHFVLRRPFSGCPEGHTFCEPCIKAWLQNHHACPSCRHKASLTRNRVLETLISKLNIRCEHSRMPNEDGNAECETRSRKRRRKLHKSKISTKKISGISKMRVPKLRAMLRSLGKPTNGKKEELVARLREAKIESDLAEQGQRDDSKEAEPQKCVWTGTLASLSAHIATCEFALVDCPYKNCNKRLERRFLGHHEKLCAHRTLQCTNDGCKEMYTVAQKEQHSNTCRYAITECPNKCGEQMARYLCSGDHLVICPLQRVDCAFRSHGCEVRPLRRDQDKHQSEAAFQHSELTAITLSQMQRALGRLLRGVSEAKEVALAAQTVAQTAKSSADEVRKTANEAKGTIDAPTIPMTILWDIEGWQRKVDDETTSSFRCNPVKVGNAPGGPYKIALKVYPRGHNCSSHVSIYFTYEGGCTSAPIKLKGSYIKLINQVNPNGPHKTRSFDEDDSLIKEATLGKGRGFQKFVKRSELVSAGLLVNDKIQIEAKICVPYTRHRVYTVRTRSGSRCSHRNRNRSRDRSSSSSSSSSRSRSSRSRSRNRRRSRSYRLWD